MDLKFHAVGSGREQTASTADLHQAYPKQATEAEVPPPVPHRGPLPAPARRQVVRAGFAVQAWLQTGKGVPLACLVASGR